MSGCSPRLMKTSGHGDTSGAPLSLSPPLPETTTAECLVLEGRCGVLTHVSRAGELVTRDGVAKDTPLCVDIVAASDGISSALHTVLVFSRKYRKTELQMAFHRLVSRCGSVVVPVNHM